MQSTSNNSDSSDGTNTIVVMISFVFSTPIFNRLMFVEIIW